VVQVRQKSQRLDCFHNAVEHAFNPDYLSLDKDQMKVTYLHLPTRQEVPVICEMSKIIEFYSRR
ncbi:MAG: 30S ribosomal protein S4, partial [Chloroflexota bacterium]